MSKEVTIHPQKHLGRVSSYFREFPHQVHPILSQAIQMHKPPHITSHPLIINLLKNQNESVVQVDHGVPKIVVHESVLRNMRVNSIIMAPRQQEQWHRRLALHHTQV